MQFRPLAEQTSDEQAVWSKHWSAENQRTMVQRFFSFYRRAVFSRTVEYFAERYFPRQAILLEAGSGTSETSIRIKKHRGARRLIAIDIVVPVLEMCHPIMDARVGGDIFRLPLASDSVDGIWNVGVMEHFTPRQIDDILKEFRRVLKPDACLFMLWPGVDSVPQRILRVVEGLIHIRNGKDEFRFHPAEISQLGSRRQAHDFLIRNGFLVLEVEFGLRSLFAFKTVVGKK